MTIRNKSINTCNFLDGYQRRDYISFNNERKSSTERKSSGSVHIPSLYLPAPKPDIRHTIAVGQALDKKHLTTTSNLEVPRNGISKRRSLGLILEHATLQSDFSSEEDTKSHLRSSENLSSGKKSHRVELSHSLSEPATSPRTLDHNFEEEEDKRTSANQEENMNVISALYMQRKGSAPSPDIKISHLSEFINIYFQFVFV